MERAFPVIYAERVSLTAGFYEELGFERHFQLPAEGEPGYVGLRRGGSELGVVSAEWPREQYGVSVGPGARFELFVYVDVLDEVVEAMRRAGREIVRDPAEMPWGERIAYVADPEGNPVALAEPGPPEA